MDRADRVRFGELVIGLGEMYHHEHGEAMVELYWQALKDLDIAAIERACATLAKESEFFPRPVHIRRACGATRPSARLLATAALDKVMARDPAGDEDPIAAKVLKQIPELRDAWWIRRASANDIAWRKRDFLAAYQAYVDHADTSPGTLLLDAGAGQDRGDD